MAKQHSKKPLSSRQISDFKSSLLLQLKELGRHLELATSAASTVELDQNRQGRLSRMDAMQGQAIAQASQARYRERLAKTKNALHRIDQGDFGRCLECGERIDPRRLELDAAVEFCLNCAAQNER